MSVTIGSLTFMAGIGDIPAGPRPEFSDITPDGVDGVSVMENRTVAPPFTIEVVQDLAAGDLNTFEPELLALQGTVVAVTDGRGVTASTAFVHRVEVTQLDRVQTPSGGTVGSAEYVYRARFTLQRIDV